MHVTFHRGRLTLKSFGKLASSNDLIQRVKAALAVFNAAQLAATKGIDWLSTDLHAPIPADAVCKICGELIEDNYVKCASCLTPHHHDCWIYYGACSMYGCQGNSFLTTPKEEEGQPLRNR